MLRAGKAENALADTAMATVQCRLLPSNSPQQVQQIIANALKSDPVTIKMTEPGDPNPASPPTPQIMARVEAALHAQWPGVLVLPALNIGASDSVYTRAVFIATRPLLDLL